MPLDLDRLEQRIVGVLVEKEHTVPESFPLTLNALVSGCNQKSNRNPEMSVEPYEIEGALHALMDRGWVIRVEKAGARTARYEHRAHEQLGVDLPDLAILTELLVRGPQTPGELKTRASRIHPFADAAAVEERLRDLAARPVPYVEQLERRPREHAARWAHRIGRPPVEDSATEEPTDTLEPPPRARPPAPPPAPALPPASDDEVAELHERIDLLEREIDELRTRLDRLEGR